MGVEATQAILLALGTQGSLSSGSTSDKTPSWSISSVVGLLEQVYWANNSVIG